MKYLGLIFAILSIGCSKQTDSSVDVDAILDDYFYSEKTQENCSQAMGSFYNADLEISETDSHDLATGLCKCSFNAYRKVQDSLHLSNDPENRALLGIAAAANVTGLAKAKGTRSQHASDAGEYYLRELIKLHNNQETAFAQAQSFMAALRQEMAYTKDENCSRLGKELRSHYQTN